MNDQDGEGEPRHSFFEVPMGALIWTLMVLVVLAAIVAMIRSPKTGSGAASLTAFHDLQPRDKQHAMETIMEMKSEHRSEIEPTGEKAEKTIQ